MIAASERSQWLRAVDCAVCRCDRSLSSPALVACDSSHRLPLVPLLFVCCQMCDKQLGCLRMHYTPANRAAVTADLYIQSSCQYAYKQNLHMQVHMCCMSGLHLCVWHMVSQLPPATTCSWLVDRSTHLPVFFLSDHTVRNQFPFGALLTSNLRVTALNT